MKKVGLALMWLGIFGCSKPPPDPGAADIQQCRQLMAVGNTQAALTACKQAAAKAESYDDVQDARNRVAALQKALAAKPTSTATPTPPASSPSPSGTALADARKAIGRGQSLCSLQGCRGMRESGLCPNGICADGQPPHDELLEAACVTQSKLKWPRMYDYPDQKEWSDKGDMDAALKHVPLDIAHQVAQADGCTCPDAGLAEVWATPNVRSIWGDSEALEQGHHVCCCPTQN